MILEDGGNGWAGRPGLVGIGIFLVMRLTLVGEPHAGSGYLMSITEIDRAVRRVVVPKLAKTLRVSPGRSRDTSIVRDCVKWIHEADALPGARIERAELLLSPFLKLTFLESEPEMIRLSQRFEFSAAHRLHDPSQSDETNRATFGKCNNPHGHGHNYELEVTVSKAIAPTSGESSDASSTSIEKSSIDVPSFERLVEKHLIDAWDHKHLNVEVEEFRDLNPSVEHIAMRAYQRLERPLASAGLKLRGVTVWETPKTSAHYAGE